MGRVPWAVRTGGMGRVCARPVRRMAGQARQEWWIDWGERRGRVERSARVQGARALSSPSR